MQILFNQSSDYSDELWIRMLRIDQQVWDRLLNTRQTNEELQRAVENVPFLYQDHLPLWYDSDVLY